MEENPANAMCCRIARIRMEFAGPRGKASFSKQLGLSPSTYDYYESSRIPPADVLVKIADLAGVDLRWLLTGDEPGTSGNRRVPTDHPAVQRAAELLSRHADAAKPLAAFLDILAATMEFPAKKSAQVSVGQEKPASASAPVGSNSEQSQPVVASISATSSPSSVAACDANQLGENWIPVLGRSAAGVPCFWAKASEAGGVTTLGDLMDSHVAEIAASRAVRTPAIQSLADEISQDQTQSVQLIRLPEPITEAGPTEYVAAGGVKSKYRDAFAVWIDGESMSPEIRHGDLVLLSPSESAKAGRAAVVQLEGAIGVTCKLYHPSDKGVHLVPINEHFPPSAVEASQIQWSLRVLARIRLTTSARIDTI